MPSRVDISTAMQNPARAFRDAKLHAVGIERGVTGLPRARSGAFAIVYRAIFPNQSSLAVRAFTSEIAERQERYQAIHNHLSKQRLSFLVPFEYSEKGLRVNGKWFPLITMEWVKGDTLFDWLEKRTSSSDGRAIGEVSDRWRETVQGLTKAQIAHGDLQHANVMITDRSEIKLVDYDGMCVPKLVGRRNEEIGVEPYQHPERNGNTQLSLSLDNFSSAFIYVGLKALSAEPRLWRDFVTQPEYDKILFRKEDFVDPVKSALFSRLRKSPDGDVQRLATRLCELWRVRIDEVPRLDELLFSFDQVRVLLDQRDFDGALAILARHKKTPAEAPGNLQPRIKDAEQRVAKRAELEAAVTAADESSMAGLVASPLLQGYPKAADALALAVDAPSVVEAIRKLDSARSAGKWREFVREWDSALPVLKRPKGSLRKSVTAFESEVGDWRERNTLCDQVLDCLRASDPNAVVLADVWKKLSGRGGHPDCDSHNKTIETVIQREHAWQAFAKVPPTVIESADLALLTAWNESLFRGWPKAEAARARLDQARVRIDAAKVFAAAATGSVTRGGEEQLIKLAAAVPAGYSGPMSTRVDVAQKRLAAAVALDAAVAADSDSGLASAFRQLENLEAKVLVDSSTLGRIETAMKREAALVTLRKIPSAYTAAQANQWDTKLIAAWNEQLLADSRDASPWRPALEEAVRRQKLLRSLADAVAKDEILQGCKIVVEPCLAGYPFDDKTKRWIEGAKADVVAIRGMAGALASGNRQKFTESFSARLVRRHADALQPHWSRLCEWVKSEVLPTERLGLQPPRAQRPLEVEQSTERGLSRCTIRWNWPELRFTDECRVMVCRNRPTNGDSPDRIKAWIDFPMTREMYQAAGGFRRQTIEPTWQGSYIVVWARIDLGSEILWSEPLVLGKV